MDSNLEIIISSHDTYSDLWDPFFLLFKRYWPDCPYKVNLVTNSLTPPKGSPADEIVGGGLVLCGNVNWAERMRFTLKQVHSEYVMLLCEDFLLCDSVENNKINHYLSLTKKYNAGVLYMGGYLDNPFADTEVFLAEEGLLEYKHIGAYRIFITPGIWRVSYLRGLLESGCESVWDFEKKVSFKSRDFKDTVIGTAKLEFPFEQGVFGGKWDIAGARLCSRCGIDIDFSKRKMMSDKDYCVRYLKSMILKLNPILITKISNLVRIGK